MNKTHIAEFIQYNGKLSKDAETYSCTFKSVKEAKKALLKGLNI